MPAAVGLAFFVDEFEDVVHALITNPKLGEGVSGFEGVGFPESGEGELAPATFGRGLAGFGEAVLVDVVVEAGLHLGFDDSLGGCSTLNKGDEAEGAQEFDGAHVAVRGSDFSGVGGVIGAFPSAMGLKVCFKDVEGSSRKRMIRMTQ